MILDSLTCNRKLPLSKEELIKKLQEQSYCGQDGIRILFLPPRMTAQNVDEFCYIYRQIMDTRYETVVIIEPDYYRKDRKITILPGSSTETPFGTLPMNERLRDDFCDEEDDFFIREDTDCHHLGFFDHASMLRLTQSECDLVGMQFTDESPPLVEELVFVLKEILPFKNALAVFCCELPAQYKEGFDTLRTAIKKENDTRLMNMIFSGESKIAGAGVFLAGVQTARHREREVRFFRTSSDNPNDNLLSGYAGFPDR